jgi:hypothetical protein
VSISSGHGGPLITPFGFGNDGPDDSNHFHAKLQFWLENKDGRRAIRYEGSQELRGNQVEVISCLSDGKVGERYWVDPSRGYLVVQQVRYCIGCTGKPADDGAVCFVDAVTASQKCSRDRWIAQRAVNVAVHEWMKSNEPMSCREVELVEFDAENRPLADTFKLKVPLGTSISNGITGVHYRAHEPEWAILDPASLPAVTHEMAEATLAFNPSPPRGRATWWVISGVVAVNVLAALVLLRWLYQRYAHAR